MSDALRLLASSRYRRFRTLVPPAIFTTDPGAVGTYVLPSWLAYTCTSTGLTSQTSASTLRTGFGADALRAFSRDGALWVALAESARTNHNSGSNPLEGSVWGEGAGGTGALVVGPSGAASEATRYTDTGPIDFMGHTISGVSAGASGCLSVWAANAVITNPGSAPPATGFLVASNNGQQIFGAAPFTNFRRFDNSGLYLAASALAGIVAPIAVDATPTYNSGARGHIDVTYVQLEDGKYPSSAIHTSGAAATRAAGKFTIASPSTVAPGGFFDLSLVVSPLFASTEQGVDANLFYLDANNRLYLQQSTSKLVLRIGGANVLSSALTFGRDRVIKVHAKHTSAGRSLEVVGAATGDGTSTAGAASAVTLPGSGYLLGSNTGAEECWGLLDARFMRP